MSFGATNKGAYIMNTPIFLIGPVTMFVGIYMLFQDRKDEKIPFKEMDRDQKYRVFHKYFNLIFGTIFTIISLIMYLNIQIEKIKFNFNISFIDIVIISTALTLVLFNFYKNKEKVTKSKIAILIITATALFVSLGFN